VVNFLKGFLKELKWIFRSRAETQSNFKPAEYGVNISTSTLCRHLFRVFHDGTTHIDKWTAECKRLDISITSQEAMAAIAVHQGNEPETQTQLRPQFTQEHFRDALAQFIVATDQV
jgi:hypothetical protein